jgi:hypothetical protein
MCLILRRCMSMLNLVMLKRKYYDKAAKEDVPVRATNQFNSIFHFKILIFN